MHLRVCMRVRGRVHVREGVSDAREGGAREGAARESVREHVRVFGHSGLFLVTRHFREPPLLIKAI